MNEKNKQTHNYFSHMLQFKIPQSLQIGNLDS